jgi:hypothetical protein
MQTTICVSSQTRDKLKAFLYKSETYDAGIRRLITAAAASVSSSSPQGIRKQDVPLPQYQNGEDPCR